MKTSFLISLLLVVTFILVSPLLAEEKWTAEQKEVQAFEEKLWSLNKPEQIEEVVAMFHPNYMGWNYARPVPGPILRQWWDYDNKVNETIVWDITPQTIQVYGNFAYIHYFYHVMIHNKLKNEDKSERGRWTDILVKEKGKWQLVGDHGGETPGK
jgi:ketosteroid isomerase-like protein